MGATLELAANPCPECGGTAWVRGRDALGREVVIRCQRCTVVRLTRSPAGIPARFLGARWSTWKPVEQLDAAVATLKSWRGIPWSLVLAARDVANLGSGKTRALVSTVMLWRVDLAVRAFYVAVPELLAFERSRLDGSGDRDPVAWAGSFPGLIALDDLGLEHGDRSGWSASIVEAVLDARYREQLPTLVATNLPAEALAEQYPRAFSRFREGVFLAWSAPDFRATHPELRSVSNGRP